MQKVPELELSSYSYSSIPRCYTYMDTGALSTSGVTGLHNHPYLKLQGKGTLVAVIDSGIDYLHPAFHNGVQSKIFSIWDQTLEGVADGRIPFGREFGRQQIEQALASENPWEIVPSSDTNGHGTRSAATAAGYRIEKDNFCGAAPEAEIVSRQKIIFGIFIFYHEISIFFRKMILCWQFLMCCSSPRNSRCHFPFA